MKSLAYSVQHIAHRLLRRLHLLAMTSLRGRFFFIFRKTARGNLRAIRYALCAILLLLATTGCNDDMKNQARYEPLEKSSFYEDGRASRAPVEGTVPRGHLEENIALHKGKVDGKHVTNFPINIDEKTLKRGMERYNIYCALCHDAVGNGNGIIVQRGFTKPPSFHEERIVNAPVGYLFDIMTNGLGDMAGYSAEVNVQDRWAIAAYIKTLQLSQNADLKDAPKDKQKELLGKLSKNG